jgi:hypothetical protein
VKGFRARNLTFESDALHAFNTNITAMSKDFPSGFHFGLPMFLFDLGMMWSAAGFIKRRNSFPRWSWLGWTGEVYLPHGYRSAWKPDMENFVMFEHEKDVRIRPLVSWYAISKHGASRQSIDNS